MRLWADAADPPAPVPHAHRAAGFVVWSNVEAGHLCPVSMTYAVSLLLGRALRA